MWYDIIKSRRGTTPITKNIIRFITEKINAKGMTPIEKNVIVVDEQGNEYEATYPKRAKGLVKCGRARFVDENKICLACPPDKNLEDKTMENTNTKYSIDYVLEQIAKIQEQTEHLNNAIEKLSQMSDGDSGEMSSPGNIQGQAKARAFGDIVKCRETTNQQMLHLYEKMYDDLKPQSSRRAEILEKLAELVANASDESAEQKSYMLDSVRQICKENLNN